MRTLEEILSGYSYRRMFIAVYRVLKHRRPTQRALEGSEDAARECEFIDSWLAALSEMIDETDGEEEL